MHTCLIWLRNDLRVHDNPALFFGVKNYDQVLPVYIIDPEEWKIDAFGHSKTGSFRTRFLLESLQDLRSKLKQLGGDLLILQGAKEKLIPELVQTYEADGVYTSKGIAYDEWHREQRIRENLNGQFHCFRQETLFHPEDVPFDPDRAPDVFTQFRKQCEAHASIRKPFPIPENINVPLIKEPGTIPGCHDVGVSHPKDDARGVLKFKGGESAGLERLKYYLWQTDCIASYKKTRNGLIGGDYSSKLAPWLANGSISPRFVYNEIKNYEEERVQNKSTYWLVFELIWRDYFRFLTWRYGNRLFYLSGLWNVQKSWDQDPDSLKKWKAGKTGIPFIDANMRELYFTGYMSNRGRQNVASFLAKDLNIDWRIGASWFESLLLDYDVYSNWGNWNYNAGVGGDPRKDRFFNIILQAKKYDPKAEFIKLWVPELAHLDADVIHDWHALPRSEQKKLAPDYYAPLIVNERWMKF